MSFDGDKLDRREVDLNGSTSSFAHHYLNGATSILSRNKTDGERFLKLGLLFFDACL